MTNHPVRSPGYYKDKQGNVDWSKVAADSIDPEMGERVGGPVRQRVKSIPTRPEGYYKDEHGDVDWQKVAEDSIDPETGKRVGDS